MTNKWFTFWLLRKKFGNFTIPTIVCTFMLLCKTLGTFIPTIEYDQWSVYFLVALHKKWGNSNIPTKKCTFKLLCKT